MNKAAIPYLRFAPSPTGYLHQGHLYSALLNKKMAERAGGTYSIRLEDIDFTRATHQTRQAIFDDLAVFNLSGDTAPLIQHKRRSLYREKIDWLYQKGLAYPCFCTRKSGSIIMGRYDRRCAALKKESYTTRIATGEPYALRLHIGNVMKYLACDHVSCSDGRLGDKSWAISALDDCIIARKDIGVSYHIAVVMDDAESAVSHIVRGEDLWAETPYHLILQRLFGYKTPHYYHHALLMDTDKTKLAKSKGSQSLRDILKAGAKPEAIVADLARIIDDQENVNWITSR